MSSRTIPTLTGMVRRWRRRPTHGLVVQTERAVATTLYPRTGRVDISPIRPPEVPHDANPGDRLP
jgi:hypothetical protein